MLNVLHSNDGYHTTNPWLVVIPRRISETGKRQFRRFPSRTAATAFATKINTTIRDHGERALQPVSPAEASDAAAARELLAGTGMTLAAAAAMALALKSTVASGVLTCQPGHGAITAAAPAMPPPAATPHIPDTTATHTLASTLTALTRARAHQSAATTANRRQRLSTLFSRNPGLAERPLASLTSRDIEAALTRAWPSAPASWNDCHKHLSAIISYAIRKEWCTRNPMPAIDLRHTTEREITALPPEDLRRLFAACRPPTDAERAAARSADPYTRRLLTQDTTDLAPYIACCAFAGVRPAECSRLRWGDISIPDHIISIRSSQSKTGGTRHIELHPTLEAWLLRHRPPAAQDSDLIAPPNDLKWRLRAIRRRAGFDASNPWRNDILRHSYATYYIKHKLGTLNQLQLNMGHRDTHLLYTRYMNLYGVTSSAAADWWSITPDHHPSPQYNPS